MADEGKEVATGTDWKWQEGLVEFQGDFFHGAKF